MEFSIVRVSKAGLVVMVAAATMVTAQAAPSVQQVEECKSFAARTSNDPSAGSPLVRARTLLAKNRECSGTGHYDVILAGLYLEGRDFDNAETLARKGVERKNEFQPNLLNILALVAYGREDLEGAYRQGIAITQQFPNYAPIYGLLGAIDMKLKRPENRMKNARTLVQIEPTALSYLVLASASYQVKQYGETVEAVKTALRMQPERIADAAGLTEGIYALINLNRREEAAQWLKQHMQANPNWKSSQHMVKAAAELGLISPTSRS